MRLVRVVFSPGASLAHLAKPREYGGVVHDETPGGVNLAVRLIYTYHSRQPGKGLQREEGRALLWWEYATTRSNVQLEPLHLIVCLDSRYKIFRSDLAPSRV